MKNFGILDIRAEINDGIQCNIEMQVVDQKNIENRILFYWSKLYSKTVKLGQDYIDSRKTVIVLVTKYELKQLKEKDEIMTKWQIKEAKCGKIVLTDLLEFYILELPKLKRNKTLNNDIENWVKFIESPEVLKMSEIKENEALKRAKEELAKISADEIEQYLAEKRELYIMDKKAQEAAVYDKGMKAGIRDGMKQGMKQGIEQGLKEGLEKGLVQGVEQGKNQEKIKIAKEMLKIDIPIDKIVKVTGLTKEVIEKLKT